MRTHMTAWLAAGVLLFRYRHQPSPALPSDSAGDHGGEVSETSVILHARLTAGDTLIDRELPGKAGRARS